MGLARTLRSHHFYTLLKLQHPSQYLKNAFHSPSTTNCCIFLNSHRFLSSFFLRPLSLSAQFQRKINIDGTENAEEKSNNNKKPLDSLFKEAVGLSEKLEHGNNDSESDSETRELKQKLWKLEEEVRSLKELRKEKENLEKQPKKEDGVMENESKPKSLYALFSDKAAAHSEKSQGSDSLTMEDPVVYKELSPDMIMFVRHLYDEGYFKDANFLPRNKFDVACFESSYGRGFVKFAAEKFGKDNQKIAKWLSASDLKKVALFGCPSIARKNVFSAKRLRIFFQIQEDMVCSKCTLKESCKFENQSVWKGYDNNLNLAVVMRVITLYAMESVPPKLVAPEEIKAAVSRLLKEILNLSRTSSQDSHATP